MLRRGLGALKKPLREGGHRLEGEGWLARKADDRPSGGDCSPRPVMS